jgi:hypothetical protein
VTIEHPSYGQMREKMYSPVQGQLLLHEARTGARTHQERKNSCLTKRMMTVEEWRKGVPGTIGETCTDSARIAGSVIVRLLTVEEAEELTARILTPVKV